MQVVKHSAEMAQLVVGSGGVGALVDFVAESQGNTRLPGIMALGYISAFSETLALSVIAEKGLVSTSSSPRMKPRMSSKGLCMGYEGPMHETEGSALGRRNLAWPLSLHLMVPCACRFCAGRTGNCKIVS